MLLEGAFRSGEKNIVFCVDHFDNRNLWIYYDQDRRQLTLASLPNIVRQKHMACWRADGNKIYILDRHDFSLSIVKNKVFNLDQKINHFWESFDNILVGILASFLDSIVGPILGPVLGLVLEPLFRAFLGSAPAQS